MKKKVVEQEPVQVMPDIVALENLVGNLQDTLAEFNDILDEILEYENTDYTILDCNGDIIARPIKIDVTKVWSN